MIEEAGERGQFASDRRSCQTAMLELGAPGQNMRSGHHAKFISGGQPDKSAKIFQVILVGAACARVVQIGKPLDRGRNLGQRLKFD
ncbi:hypothetical protein ALP03_200076 [Pseudomonas amygdali pv. tabaci]|uniref:Uncharacterized protein n=1 Tax=Pseudomonas amygdali pv. tabaci TaxID=322 RepID=A0A3M6HR27_PSEAJ|nr:hypothetical protein ALP03_200076 [Pseudomonas amygdali pv. tabaci]